MMSLNMLNAQNKVSSQPLIEISYSEITMTNTIGAYSEYCSVTVFPTSMQTTITLIDTGDGTSFATVSPMSGTGSYSFRARSTYMNKNEYSKSMIARITDNAGVAVHRDVVVRQYGTIIE